VIREQRRGRLGLDRHQADVMGDDVVQFARDPGALARRGARGLPVDLGFGPLGPALRGQQAGPLGPAEHARRSRGEEDQRLVDGLVLLAVTGRGQREPQPDHDQHEGDPAPHRAAAVHDRVERDRRAERQRREPEPDLVVGDLHAADDDHDRQRPRPPPGERNALRGDQRQREPQRVKLVPVGQQREHVDVGQRDPECRVLEAFLAARRKLRDPRGQVLG